MSHFNKIWFSKKFFPTKFTIFSNWHKYLQIKKAVFSLLKRERLSSQDLLTAYNKKFALSLVFAIVALSFIFVKPSYAVSPMARVVISPLEEISYNTVEVGTTWVTANTGLYNRKAISIFNLSDSEIIYVAESTTANTASITNSRHLFPRASVTYGLSSKNQIYVSCDSTVFVTFTEIR